jgi:phage baseplate assembly protein W
MMILGTIPGERVMLPTFGSRLPLLLFEPNDVILVQQVREETAQAVQRWDPSIVVVGVAPEIEGNSMRIFIDYFDKRDLTQELRRTVFSLKR